jgi:hypothetical protein
MLKSCFNAYCASQFFPKKSVIGTVLSETLSFRQNSANSKLRMFIIFDKWCICCDYMFWLVNCHFQVNSWHLYTDIISISVWKWVFGYLLAEKSSHSMYQLSNITSYCILGIESWWGRDFLCLSRLALGPTQPPVQWVLGLFPGVKWPGCGIDNPPHLALRLKKE